MVCERIKTPEGVWILCSRGRRARRCDWCSLPRARQCDYRQDGKTCNASLCEQHAQSVGLDLDYCPTHAHRPAPVTQPVLPGL